MSEPKFSRYIGIDYSGAKTPTANLPGLQVYMVEGEGEPKQQLPSTKSSPSRKNWNRRDIAKWLVERLSENRPTLVGIDHAFSFPIRYFEEHGLAHDWPAFLEDFQRHWPTDENIRVDCVREGKIGNSAARKGNTQWRRLTEEQARTAKSVFHFDVQGQVAKSTHAGIPWLDRIRQELKQRRAVHFWPFDGWTIRTGNSAIVEVYPTLFSHCFAPEDRNLDQHDAYSVAAWMSESDRNGRLDGFLKPKLKQAESKQARIEGWILGVA